MTGWTWDPLAEKWEKTFGQLLRYVELSGHANVPQSYKVDGNRLGAWVTRQRGSYSRGTLEADRQRRLQEVTNSVAVWGPSMITIHSLHSGSVGSSATPRMPTPRLVGRCWPKIATRGEVTAKSR